MTVSELMTKNPITVSPDEDVNFGFYLLKKHDIRQLPVVENDKLLGIVTERDLRMLIEKPPIKIRSAMSTNIYKVTENASVQTAARIVQEKKINALPVLNDANKIVGIITVTDILEGLLQMLKDK